MKDDAELMRFIGPRWDVLSAQQQEILRLVYGVRLAGVILPRGDPEAMIRLLDSANQICRGGKR